MKNIGFKYIEVGPYYDVGTRDAIKQIQNKYGIVADGVVGSLTKIFLCNEEKSLPIPHIISK